MEPHNKIVKKRNYSKNADFYRVLGLKYAKKHIAMIVALTVTAGYWFTSSTFFCNPAVTFARSLTDTFVGIAPQNILGFVIPQIVALILILQITKK